VQVERPCSSSAGAPRGSARSEGLQGGVHIVCNQTNCRNHPIGDFMNFRTLTGTLVVLLSACGPSGVETGADGTSTLRSALSGPHYNLNIIGVPKDKSADMTGSDGHRIFVPLDGKADIELAQGDFQVLDANGTDGTASFQLPNPDPDGDGVTAY